MISIALEILKLILSLWIGRKDVEPVEADHDRRAAAFLRGKRV